jgi:hypothetical protein
MEISEIVARYAEGLAYIDSHTTEQRANQRTGEIYLQGLKTLSEVSVITQLDQWWSEAHPEDFSPNGKHEIQVPYPGQNRNKCDQVITTDGNSELPEWAIEAKYLQLIGDNGKRNDFAVAKGLSPFLKDRSLYHDVERMRENPLARRLAVIGFSFTYDSKTCDRAQLLHPTELQRINEIREVCRQNGGSLSIRPIVEFADGIFKMRELIENQYSFELFDAWRHPCGGKAVVFGWEVKHPNAQSIHRESLW